MTLNLTNQSIINSKQSMNYNNSMTVNEPRLINSNSMNK